MNSKITPLRDQIAYCIGLLLLLMVQPAYAEEGGVSLDGLTRALKAFGPVLTILCVFVGFILIGYSLIKGATLSRPDGGGSKPAIVVATLLTGALLINIGLVVETMSRSMGFSTEASKVLSEGKFYTADAGFAEYTSGINFAFAVIQTVGALAIARGLILIKKSSQGAPSGQGVSIGHAATHLVGGTLALNIKPFLGILGKTMGGDANSIIQLIINGVIATS